MDDAVQDSEDVLVGFKPLLELDILVPKWVREEVKADTLGSSFKQPMPLRSVSARVRRGKQGEGRRREANTVCMS